jgi:hypothetical protein
MMVMPANNGKSVVHYWAGKYPGRIGHLYSPDGFRAPVPWLPYALDNGRFPAWSAGKAWDEDGYRRMLDRAAESGFSPRWALVPDVVADREGTLAEWDRWAALLSGYGWPLAFAVQDGMDEADVPDAADVVFVGGSTEWKRRTFRGWCKNFGRVHVGRINTERWLWECHLAGAESCDGTGWFRGDKAQLAGLERYLERAATSVPGHTHAPDLFGGYTMNAA